MNAFMIWAREFRRKLAEQMPNASNAEISVGLGQVWRKLPAAEKQKFYIEAEKVKNKHRKDFPGWIYQPNITKRPYRTTTEVNHTRMWQKFVKADTDTSHTTYRPIAPSVPANQQQHNLTIHPLSHTPNNRPDTQAQQGSEKIPNSKNSHQNPVTLPSINTLVSKTQPVTVTNPTTGTSSFSKAEIHDQKVQGSTVSTNSPSCGKRSGRPPTTTERRDDIVIIPSETSNAPKTQTQTEAHNKTKATAEAGKQKPARKKEKNPRRTTEPIRQKIIPTENPKSDLLWPFPFPPVEQSPQTTIFYEGTVPSASSSKSDLSDPYAPFYFDNYVINQNRGTELQVDVNSWQQYLNHEQQRECADRQRDLDHCFGSNLQQCPSDLEIQPAPASNTIHQHDSLTLCREDGHANIPTSYSTNNGPQPFKLFPHQGIVNQNTNKPHAEMTYQNMSFADQQKKWTPERRMMTDHQRGSGIEFGSVMSNAVNALHGTMDSYPCGGYQDQMMNQNLVRQSICPVQYVPSGYSQPPIPYTREQLENRTQQINNRPLKKRPLIIESLLTNDEWVLHSKQNQQIQLHDENSRQKGTQCEERTEEDNRNINQDKSTVEHGTGHKDAGINDKISGKNAPDQGTNHKDTSTNVETSDKNSVEQDIDVDQNKQSNLESCEDSSATVIYEETRNVHQNNESTDYTLQTESQDDMITEVIHIVVANEKEPELESVNNECAQQNSNHVSDEEIKSVCDVDRNECTEENSRTDPSSSEKQAGNNFVYDSHILNVTSDTGYKFEINQGCTGITQDDSTTQEQSNTRYVVEIHQEDTSNIIQGTSTTEEQSGMGYDVAIDQENTDNTTQDTCALAPEDTETNTIEIIIENVEDIESTSCFKVEVIDAEVDAGLNDNGDTKHSTDQFNPESGDAPIKYSARISPATNKQANKRRRQSEGITRFSKRRLE